MTEKFSVDYIGYVSESEHGDHPKFFAHVRFTNEGWRILDGWNMGTITTSILFPDEQSVKRYIAGTWYVRVFDLVFLQAYQYDLKFVPVEPVIRCEAVDCNNEGTIIVEVDGDAVIVCENHRLAKEGPICGICGDFLRNGEHGKGICS